MANTTNFGWETPDDTDLVKDGAAAMRTLGNAIDTSFVDLKGGTTGQVLSKASNTDLDFTWVAQDDSNAIQNAIVDAKGDLISATANDTPARLAVGNNGETLVADSSATTGLRWNPLASAGKNAVINGAFDIWQRGTSISVATGTFPYTADRWNYFPNGSNNAHTVSRQATNDTTNLPNIQYCGRFQRNSGQTGTSAVYLCNSFETANSIPFVGKTVTLSFYARKGANYSSASDALAFKLYSGTGTDQLSNTGYTGASALINSTATLTTTWQRFTGTGTVSASATELSLEFSFTPVGTAGAADYFEITGVQLELGSVATAFTRNSGTLAGELAACQRYYYRVEAGAINDFMTPFGTAYNTTNALLVVNNKTTMRVKPTSIDYASVRLFDGINGAIAVTNLVIDTGNGNTFALIATVASGLTQYRPYALLANTNPSYFGVSAEL